MSPKESSAHVAIIDEPLAQKLWLGEDPVGSNIKLLALALGFALRSAVFGSKAIEPLAFIAGPLCLLAASLVACYLPARRASTIEPIAALHYE